MIAEPLNDAACLGQLTEIASKGASSSEITSLASRFANTVALTRWIRTLPQRDDAGQSNDGPRVMCDVGQRARLIADDPNCVERSILYLAAAEVIDPAPVRQLVTVDVSETLRHTFPVENGEPVVLDPRMRRNSLRASLWRVRNGDQAAHEQGTTDAASLIGWLLDLAEESADEAAGERGVRRVVRARYALAVLLDGGRIHPRDRAQVLYALRLAGDVAPWFGEAGREGYRAARRLVARLVTCQTVGTCAPRNLSAERVAYWGGKAVATFYGVGGLYDAAYDEVNRRPVARVREQPAARVAVRPGEVAVVVPESRLHEVAMAPPAMVLGTLGEIAAKKGP